MQHSTAYILLFAAAVCGICSIFVASSAVLLKERQQANVTLDRQKQVLAVAGLVEENARLSAEQAARLFEENIQAEVVDLKTGTVREGIDPATFDQRKAAADLDTSAVNIRLRELMATHRDLARKLLQLEKKYDAKFSVVFEAIRKLMGPDEPPPSRQIGFQAKK